MRGVDLAIRTHGWFLQMVTDAVPFSYTVGLTESFGHPELMMIGMELDRQSSVIRRIVEPIEQTGHVDTADVAAAGITLVDVHDNHLDGDWFGTWVRRYGHLPPAAAYLQVVPPAEWFCSCHQHSTPRFDRPGPIRAGNRAERRRRRGAP